MAATGVLVALTARQRAVLALVAAGLTNREIARRLCVEASTIDNHLTAIYRILDVPNRVAAALLWARETGG